jgi:chromosome segregation ATPase
MDEKEALLIEIQELDRQIDILAKQIDNCDRNVTALIEQKSRHMDRRDLLEGKKARLETELEALLEEAEAGA